MLTRRTKYMLAAVLVAALALGALVFTSFGANGGGQEQASSASSVAHSASEHATSVTDGLSVGRLAPKASEDPATEEGPSSQAEEEASSEQEPEVAEPAGEQPGEPTGAPATEPAEELEHGPYHSSIAAFADGDSCPLSSTAQVEALLGAEVSARVFDDVNDYLAPAGIAVADPSSVLVSRSVQTDADGSLSFDICVLNGNDRLVISCEYGQDVIYELKA